MTRLAPAAYLAHLHADTTRFHEVLAAGDPAAPVPTCPEWRADVLLWHLGEVQRFWATVLRTRPLPPADNGVDAPQRPDSHAGLLAFADAAGADLVAQLAAADPADPAWSWAAEQTVAFTLRRQAHEALVHRVDAELTAGLAPSPVDPALAADGVAELMEVMYGGEPPSWGSFTATSGTVRVDLVDVGASLWLQPGEFSGTDPESGANHDGPHLLVLDGPAGEPAGEPAAVVSGRAADLDLWWWHRSDVPPATSGDPVALAALAAAVAPPLT